MEEVVQLRNILNYYVIKQYLAHILLVCNNIVN